MNVITKTVKRIVPVVPDTFFYTSLGVRMRNPINKKGEWIGWTAEEVAEHLQSVRNYTTIHLPEKLSPNEK